MATTKYFTEREAVWRVGLRTPADGRTTLEIMDSLHICADAVYEWRRRLEHAVGDVEKAAAEADLESRTRRELQRRKTCLAS